MANAETLSTIYDLIVPFNKKGIELTPETTFATNLELDSLTVMDLVAEIEDEFDIVLPLNLLPDLETISHVADAVDKIVADNG
ncbi:acyl carrier protein [Kordiimonas sp. SCSIO 12610]|uniref:acyl carrier protein n=1 Tax=Kordiimonas sp. SCSIO 12610 TaxID=2829597 RepID=UPI00210EC3DE|nr:phosphopantetheine-binding protein [Kordiimonas sp. SCSIO 12610]UTW56619.1 acyl carrier protein [Kordiimonas sp. SCSIO 12610]